MKKHSWLGRVQNMDQNIQKKFYISIKLASIKIFWNLDSSNNFVKSQFFMQGQLFFCFKGKKRYWKLPKIFINDTLSGIISISHILVGLFWKSELTNTHATWSGLTLEKLIFAIQLKVPTKTPTKKFSKFVETDKNLCHTTCLIYK